MEWMAKRLKELRKATGLRQEQVAEYLEVDQSFISMIEKDVRKLNAEQLDKLLSLYGVDLATFNNKDIKVEPISISFRANVLDVKDLQAIAEIRKIAVSNRFMEELLNGNK